jgi:hypothetical protein
MDFEVMKKKLEAYRTPKGQIRNVKSELLLELLRMWEVHAGPSALLARTLGMKGKQLARLITEARKLATSTDAIDPSFHQLPSQGEGETPAVGSGIELSWGSDQVIRFPSVDVLVDFLKKAS